MKTPWISSEFARSRQNYLVSGITDFHDFTDRNSFTIFSWTLERKKLDLRTKEPAQVKHDAHG